MATKTDSKRATAQANDAKIAKQVVSELKGGSKLSEVASKHNITPGKAAFLRMCAEVKPKDRIKADNDDALGKAIVTARKTGLSWGQIAARASEPEGKVKRLYEQASGKSTKGLRLAGKGGRAATAGGKASGKASGTKKTGTAKKGTRRVARRTRPSKAA